MIEICREFQCGKPAAVAGQCCLHYEIALSNQRLTADGLMWDGVKFVLPTPAYRQECIAVRHGLKGRLLGGIVKPPPMAERRHASEGRKKPSEDSDPGPCGSLHPEERERLRRAYSAPEGVFR